MSFNFRQFPPGGLIGDLPPKAGIFSKISSIYGIDFMPNIQFGFVATDYEKFKDHTDCLLPVVVVRFDQFPMGRFAITLPAVFSAPQRAGSHRR